LGPVVQAPAAPPKPADGPPARPVPDRLARRVLRVPEDGARVDQARAERLFSTSIVLSASRCLATYVVLPVISLVVQGAATVGPDVGVPLGVLALVFDVVGIRRFWLADHRWRWPVTAIYLMVMVLVVAFLVIDVSALAR
jgi:hypothetical protein